MLPLARGIYVLVGTDCKSASNVDILSYWGEDDGINDQRTDCRITKLAKSGRTYSLQRTCTDIREGVSFDDSAEVTVVDRTSFIMHRASDPDTEVRRYRFCGLKVQF
jgi:hypothetical protein